MKLRLPQLAILVGLLAALLIMASGLAAQEATPNFPLTATALSGGGSGTAATATITPLPSLTPGAAATLTPLPSLTPAGQVAPTRAPTEVIVATTTPAPSLTALPSLTPVMEGVAAGAEATPTSVIIGSMEDALGISEAQPTADLAPIRIVVPYVSPAQEPPPAPEGAAGLGTLVLLMGLGGATVVGLLMLARDRYRHQGDE
ncbi:MAG TPA: hypothetical protein VER79_04775 [Candidatus Limnocylindrales bacterium]|nr:hypothetical protein [Candidatus Limnocylindrales bacterium]